MNWKRKKKKKKYQIKFLAADEVCRAIFQLTACLKERAFDSCGFSAEDTLISCVRSTPPQRSDLLRMVYLMAYRMA